MKTLLAICGIVSLAGCTTTSRMDVEDLNYFRVDCSKKYDQLAFLEKQIPGRDERFVNSMRMTSPIGAVVSVVNGTYYEDHAMFNDRQQNIAKTLIYQIRSHCPDPVPTQTQCTHINENFPSGSSQGARCYQKSVARPVVDRWEVIDR